MKETEKLPYASPVEALLLSRRNNLGQPMCVPEAIGSLLSEMIRSEVRLVAASLEMIHLGKADVTPVRSLTSLPIPIIGDLSRWRR